VSIIETPPKPKLTQNNPEELASILDQLDQFSPSAEAPKKSSSSPKKASQVQSEEPSEELLEETPSPTTIIQNFPRSQPQPQYPQFSASDQTQELVESIIEEKWQQVIEKFGDLGIWKERTSRDLISLKQELLRTQDRFQQLQRAVLGKVAEYNDNISNVNSEMKALEKVFEKIIDPLTHNIKELQKVAERLKK